MNDSPYPLRSIYFYLTKYCNLKCRHCWMAPEHQASLSGANLSSYLDLGLIRSIIDQANDLGLESVKLTGGEPLLHPQIEEIIRLIRDSGNHLVIETNGILCSTLIAELIKSLSPNVFVSVSLDGSNALTHDWVRGVRGSYRGTISGIENLVKVGLKPQIIMSLMRRNKDQIESVVRLAEELGVGSVKFNPVQPTARGASLHEGNETLSINELVSLGAWVENSLAEKTNLRLIYTHPMAFRPLSRMFAGEKTGCSLCGVLSILGVLSDGSFSLCGIGESVPELVFGHAADQPLEEIWCSNPILRKLREGLPERLAGVCGDCLMKAMCRGSCIAQNFYSSGDLWSPYWYCDQAYRAGLFPIERLRKSDSGIGSVSRSLSYRKEEKGERNGMGSAAFD